MEGPFNYSVVYHRTDVAGQQDKFLYNTIKHGKSFRIDQVNFEATDEYIFIKFTSPEKIAKEYLNTPQFHSSFYKHLFEQMETKTARTETYSVLSMIFYKQYPDDVLLEALVRAFAVKKLNRLDKKFYPQAFEILINAGAIDILKEFPDFTFLNDEDNNYLVYNLIPDGKPDILLAIIDKISPVHFNGFLYELDALTETDPEYEHLRHKIEELRVV